MTHRHLLPALLTIGGCLSVFPVPYEAALERCAANDCAPYACRPNGSCYASCESGFECTEDALCTEEGLCTALGDGLCPVMGCDGGYACDPRTGECEDYCYNDDDCADEFRCCTADEFLDDICDFGDCIPE